MGVYVWVLYMVYMSYVSDVRVSWYVVSVAAMRLVCASVYLMWGRQYRCMDGTGDVDLCMLVMEICVVLAGDGVYPAGCC